MKKFVTSTLALAAAGSLGFAGPGDSEWSGLDSQLNTIRSSYTAEGGLGSSFGAVLRVSLVSIDVEIAGLHGFGVGDDVLAIDLSNANAWIEGEVNPEVNWRVSFDLYGGGSGVSLYEAYIDAKFGSGLLRSGMQLVPTARSLAFAPENRLFHYAPVSHTAGSPLAAITMDEAITWIGSSDNFSYSVAAANDGGDGDVDELTLIGKVTWMNADIDAYEGPFGNSDDSGMAVSLFYVDQGGVTDGTTIGVDFVWDASNWSVSGGILDNDVGHGDNSPFFVQGGINVGENGVAGIRYSDTDNAAEQTRITGVYQHYSDNQNHTYSVELGQDDTTATDGTFIAFNITAGNFGNYQDPITGVR
jgi:hypothetical protein